MVSIDVLFIVMIRFCVFITNHGLEITLFSLYIVLSASDVNNCFAF